MSATIDALLAYANEPDPSEDARISTESARVTPPGDANGFTRQQAAICKTGSRKDTRPSGDTRQRERTRDHSAALHLETTARNKMGNLISKLVTHVSPSQLSNDANTASIVKFPRDPKQRNPMAPEVDEMPSPTGSATSLDSTTGGGGGGGPPLPSSLFWPYTNVRRTGEYCSDGNLAILAVRRPALYQEYWAEGQRCLSRA